MSELANELKTTIPATFESEEYQARIQELQEEVTRRQQQGLSEIQEEANANNIAMLTTPAGFTFAPMRNGEVIEPEEYKTFSDEEKELVESKVEDLQKKLQQAIQQVPRLRKEVRERVHALNEEMVQLTLGGPMGSCARSGGTCRPWSRTSTRCERMWWSMPRRFRILKTAHRQGC